MRTTGDMYFSKADHVLSGSQTRKDKLREAYERLVQNRRHIFQDLGRRTVEKSDTGDFDSVVGCRCCALLLEADEMLCGTLEDGGHRVCNDEEFNERTFKSIEFRTDRTRQCSPHGRATK